MKDQDRCPYCLAELHPPPADEAPAGAATGAGPEPTEPADPLVSCKRCGTPHHEACFQEHGRCCVFGCACLESVAGEGPRHEPGSLHPFLPTGEGLVDRHPSFLSVAVTHRAREVSALALRLELPDTVMCGQLLEGKLVASAPQAVQGLGLRLVTEAVMARNGRDETIYQEAAALVGRPPRPWLERLRLYTRGELGTLLEPGSTRFRFSWQPGLLHLRQDLPRDGAFGSWHVLRVWAELDAGEQRVTRAHRVLVRHGHARCEAQQRRAIKIRWRAATPRRRR